MKKVFVHGSYLISSLGFGTEENAAKLFSGESGSRLINDKKYYPKPFFGSEIDHKRFQADFNTLLPDNQINFPLFEQLLLFVIQQSLNQFPIDLKSKETLLIISSTKGNINLLAAEEKNKWDADRVFLWKSAQIIQEFFGLNNKVIVLSNACISGVEAIGIGSRLIREGSYKNVIVAGADILSEFVVAGFQSFQSLSPELCLPYDESRVGLNLGEAAGAIILSSDEDNSAIEVLGSGVSNDANHISGPSRTGDGLYLAIQSAIIESGINASSIDYISGHGTATNYNDEMESKAFQLAGLENTPVNSLKAYWGHTLGAAGLIESIAALETMKANRLVKTLGFDKLGVSVPIDVIKESRSKTVNTVLKTASGFGGANAAIIFKKTKSDG
jgi:3-oxoacyl-[acyl-carrier-protein] synthase-1